MLIATAAMAQGGGSTPHVTIGGSVFGGGNLAAYTGTPEVNVTAGTVGGSVFGGGNEAGVGGNTRVIVNGQNQ